MVPGGGERGQAASEYLALVALVATALALAAGITSGGVGRGVLAGLQRALCLVAAGPCARPLAPRPDLAPCPLARDERTEELSGLVAVVRLGSSGTLGVERTSDGRATVTLADGSSAGGEVGVGLRVGRAGGRARAGAGLAWTSGRVWRLPDAAAARRFVDRFGAKATIGGKLVDELRSTCSVLCDAIGWRPHAPLPEPDATFVEGGPFAALTASFGLGEGAAVGALSIATVLGRRVDRDGATTWYLGLEGALAAGLELPPDVAGRLAGGGQGVLSYELDARGRPRALGVHLAGEVGAGVEAAGWSASADGGVAELDATLDLRERRNRTAAAGLLAALRDPRALGNLPRRLRELGGRIVRESRIDLRRYALSEDADETGLQVALGVEFGAGLGRTTRGLRLTGAWTRLPGLPLLPRDDCRPA